MNTAFLQDGALVYVPDGVVLPAPVHLQFLAANGQPRAVHPRVLVVVGAGAQATLVEEYADLESGPGFTNAVTEIVVGPGAVVDSYRLQRRGAEAYHVGSTRVTLGRDSSFSCLTLDAGAALARNDLDVLLTAKAPPAPFTASTWRPGRSTWTTRSASTTRGRTPSLASYTRASWTVAVGPSSTAASPCGRAPRR